MFTFLLRLKATGVCTRGTCVSWRTSGERMRRTRVREKRKDESGRDARLLPAARLAQKTHRRAVRRGRAQRCRGAPACELFRTLLCTVRGDGQRGPPRTDRSIVFTTGAHA